MDQLNANSLFEEQIKRALLYSDDEAALLQTVRAIRFSISQEGSTQGTLDFINNNDLLPSLYKLLTPGLYSEQIQHEAAWSISNYFSSSGSWIQQALAKGGANVLANLFRSTSNPEIAEQCAWALGNIAGESIACRDLILSMDVVVPIGELLAKNINTSSTRTAAWVISNLSRGKPNQFEYFREIIPTIVNTITNTGDSEVKQDLLWALSYLSDGPNANIDTITSTGIIPLLVSHLIYPDMKIAHPVLRTVGNISAGTHTHSQLLLNHNILSSFKVLLKYESMSIVRESCWALSNLAAGPIEHIHILCESEIIPLVVHTALHSQRLEVKREALWVLCNMTSGGEYIHIEYLLNNNILAPMEKFLPLGDNQGIQIVLEALSNILNIVAVNQECHKQVVKTCVDLGYIDTLRKIVSQTSFSYIETVLQNITEHFATYSINLCDEISQLAGLLEKQTL
eukprot:TRINITY_DN1744_c2_g1_i2.p1 TRINITY_DN1744_c2_g1~~TRINITY_DN1744_c2_g1_i2.p1  ORF type:complete len:455 (-),score=85.83 TRINITY_DN1744_c2_g1_i2:90-1454(-)